MATRPLTALIVDDEPLARQELEFLLKSAGGVEVVAQGSNGIEAVEMVRAHKPDVLFLDVQMPVLDGFAVLKKIIAMDRRARLPEVVFATAFDQYAVRAFEVNAVDYLLKPFDEKRLKTTVDKLHARVASAAETPASPTEAKLDELLRMMEERATPARSSKVVVRAAGRMLLVDQKDVCFASTDGGAITVATRNAEGESTARTLEELQEQLAPDHFWRVHRSHLVNIQHIREVVPWFNSAYQLRMDDRKATGIPVARAQVKRLKEMFNL